MRSPSYRLFRRYLLRRLDKPQLVIVKVRHQRTLDPPFPKALKKEISEKCRASGVTSPLKASEHARKKCVPIRIPGLSLLGLALFFAHSSALLEMLSTKQRALGLRKERKDIRTVAP